MPAENSNSWRQTLGLIERLDSFGDVDALFDATYAVLAQFGIDRLLFTGLPQHYTAAAVLAARWPAGYVTLFIAEDYMRFDPLARMCRNSIHPFTWCTADFDREPEPRSTEVIRRAADFGLTGGLVVPIRSAQGMEGCVSLCGDDFACERQVQPICHLLALYAFERIRHLRGVAVSASPLTEREREVLTWVANGKSAWEIGEILNISKRTVDEHAQTAYRKLGALNRTHAVAIALRERIIRL